MIDFVICSIKRSRITTCKLQYFFHNSVSMILIVYHALFQNALKTYHLKIEIYSHNKEEKQKSIIVLCRGHLCYVVDNHRYMGDKKAILAFTD
jgi:hypothetical protein